MLEFTCNHCNQRLRLDETWAGKRCRCGRCNQIVEVPRLIPVNGLGPGSTADMPTVIPDQSGTGGIGAVAAAKAHCDFLAPAQAVDEIGRLGGYRVFEVIGIGGMGIVLRAEDVRLKRPVALKAMLPILATSAENRQRFVQEAQAAAALEHEHIVTIYQVGEDRGVPFIAMQLLQGESLEERLQQTGLLLVKDVLAIGTEIAQGLAVAHAGGLIHRDIKPSNIFLVKQRVKILDFGLARSVGGDSQLTRNGAIIGTPAYMAPEQSRGQKVDARSDLFSLGCVLYRMCTGRMAFNGADAIATLLAVANENPPPPHQVQARVPPRLSRLIMDLLAKEPKSRPASAEAVIAELLEIQQGPSREHAPSVAPSKGKSGPALPSSVSVTPDLPTAVMEPGLPSAGKPKWIRPASLVGGGLMCLILLLALLLRGGTAPNKHDPVPDVQSKRDQKDPDKKDPIEKPVQVGPGILPPETLARLQNAVQNKNYAPTTMVGFPHHAPFEDVAPQGGLLIGFEVGTGKFIQNEVIHSLRPIFWTEKGEVVGQTHGKVGERTLTVKAKSGYAVAAVTLKTRLLIDGITITFMRLDKKLLDPDDSYQSESIGSFDGSFGTGQTIGGSGALVIGICGRSDGNVCNALGLVLCGKTP